MATDHRRALANIRRFDQLIAYLRDEMGWPIARDSFEEVDDLFYDFTADELGIDPKTAAKITEIKRLKPLSTRQPWGIFFVKFEPRKLPVVALRRILSQVAMKKRASANSAERTAWAADDLLFVSNYGEGDERQISFAHFSRAPEGHDLPTLKVLGWDNLDTALHLDAVARELTQELAWPADEKDIDAWRQRWRGAFTLRHREVIDTSKDLANRLAELARAIRDRIKAALAIETDRGPLTKLFKAFQESLVHDLDAEGFADMYAQTIAYGLLSARIADPYGKTADDISTHMRTNPFLKELMQTFLHIGGRRGKAGGPGIDFDELGVSDVVELLDHANMEAVVRDFGDRNRQEDPVMHFYESFLREYNKQLKIQRGVFYTPQPVVSYIVRSVHELLQTQFGLVDGLADTTTWGEMLKKHPGLRLPPLTDEAGEKRTISPDESFVQILDPATGTATFLVEVIDVIYRTLSGKWKQQRLTDVQQREAWNAYVPKHLLPRLHAFELMIAPYAIAHMKISLKLAETGYGFGTEERARIYLTNALEPWVNQLPLIGFDALAHEATAVNEIKRYGLFTVIIGNPPYSNFGQLNKIPFILDLLEDYKSGLNEKKINLDDDFIKFVCLSQNLLARTGSGVMGMITNNVFFDGLTHRRMRESLLSSFPAVVVVDLHGNTSAQETALDGSKDENVFDITQGVGITLMSRPPRKASALPSVTFNDLRGTRASKYAALQSNGLASSIVLSPCAPHFFMVPKDLRNDAEYRSFWSVTEVFAQQSYGIQTKRDALTIAFAAEELLRRAQSVLDMSDEAVRERFDLAEDGRDWAIRWARADLKRLKSPRANIQRVLYRPFDTRWTIYTDKSKGFLAYPRWDTMRCMLSDNLALVAMRQVFQDAETYSHFVATNLLIDERTFYSNRGGTYLFPLYGDNDGEGKLFAQPLKGRKANLGGDFLRELSARLARPLVDASGLPDGISAEDIFYYGYAVFHSPSYRSRYAEFLKIEFPRLPLTARLDLFRALSRLGGELVSLHLLASPDIDTPLTDFIGGCNPEIERISWAKNTVWVDAAQTIGFKGVREDVWSFHVGGYQVCYKWLKDRKGRTLSKDEIAHYQKIVVALSESIRLMKNIDQVIEKHGDWPAAFVSERIAALAGAARDVALPQNVVRIRDEVHPQAEPYISGAPRLKIAAEPPVPKFNRESAGAVPHEAAGRAEDLDREDLIFHVRQLFTDGDVREREGAISELARGLGYQRTGPRIHEVLDDTIRTAVRRGVLENAGGNLKIGAKSIEQYERDFLKDQFLASLGGSAWTDREDAIRAFARWLGFRRTGPAIDETARSLINGLIRAARIESEGTQIRKAR